MSMDTAHEHENATHGQEEAEAYIREDEVLAEVPDDGDHPMDDDDDNEFEPGQPGDQETDEIVWEDNSVQHFSAHRESVFAVAIHPSEPIAVSGGQDDLGYLWNINNGETIAKLTGHTDSVVGVGFSWDGEMVATGGMDGKVRVWRRVGTADWKIWEFLTEIQGPDEVVWLRWHPKGNVLLAGANDGTVWLWQLPSGTTMQVFTGHTGTVHSGQFTPDGKRILTGCSDGILIFWDPRSTTPIFKLTPEDARFQIGGITGLGVNPSSTLAVVGGGNGGVRVISLNKGEIITGLIGHTEGESIEAVGFVDISGNSAAGPGVAVTGGIDGKICIWDLTTMRLRSTLKHEDAITNIRNLPPPKAHFFAAGSADGAIRTWDARTGQLVREHKGHQGAILGISMGLQGTVIATAGDDGLCLIFPTT